MAGNDEATASAIAIVVGPDGEVLWTGPDKEKALFASKSGVVLSEFPAFLKVLGAQCLDITEEENGAIKSGAVFAEAERLNFLTKQGAAQGFVNVLPRGLLFDRRVDAANSAMIGVLNPVEMAFPVVYPCINKSIKDLTHHYEQQGRVFHIENMTAATCLAYAADPCLFQFLEGRRLFESRLPFTVLTKTHFLRRFQRGEINGLNRSREFTFPELHTFVPLDEMETFYLKEMEMSAEGMRLWFDEDWVYKCDVRASFYDKNKDLFPKMARAIRQPIYVRILSDIPIYYDIKTQFLIDSGFGYVMIYNMQWDQKNGERFNICTSTGAHVGIIHGTLAGGCSRLLPAYLGRALAGLGPEAIRPELQEYPLEIVSLPQNLILETLLERLASFGIGARVTKTKNIGSTITKLKGERRGLICVTGPRDTSLDDVNVQDIYSQQKTPIEKWMSDFSMRNKLFSSAQLDKVSRTDLPW